MRRAIRLLISGAIGAVVVVLTTGVVVPRLGGPKLFAGEAAELCKVCWEENLKSEALAVRDRAVQRSLEGKREVVRELAEGKMGLAEAAERFRHLNTLLDDGQDHILGSYTLAEGDAQDIYDNLLCWVGMTLRDQPQQREMVLNRLQREWEQHVAGKGKRSF